MVKKIPKFFLKDRLFNREKVEKLAGEIHGAYPLFKKDTFLLACMEKFPELELKQRMYHIRDMLYTYLPKDYPTAIEIIKKALPKELDNTKTDDDFGDFIHAPYAEYISAYGIQKNYLELSLSMIEEISKRFSGEYAIRHFFNKFEDETFEKCLDWSQHSHYHIRRLASEGSRPRLPWGIKINLNYTKTESILDNLFFDKTRYVTRSVANHLNDISKIDEDWVLKKLNEWEKSGKQTPKEMQYIRNHATRTLRKKRTK